MKQYPLRLPPSLMKMVKALTDKDNMSMNQFFVTAIAEKISALETENYLAQRAQRADYAAFENILSKAPDGPPVYQQDQVEG